MHTHSLTEVSVYIVCELTPLHHPAWVPECRGGERVGEGGGDGWLGCVCVCVKRPLKQSWKQSLYVQQPYT